MKEAKERKEACPFRKTENGDYFIDIRWSGYPRLQVSTRTKSKPRANAMIETLRRLKSLGRRDVFEKIRQGVVRLDEVHDQGRRDISALDRFLERSSGKPLGELVKEWLSWLRLPSTIAPKTRRRYSTSTVERYEQSWEKVFQFLPQGREASVGALTKGFLTDYRTRRMEAGCSGPTVNRDIVAFQSFLRWLREEKEEHVPSFTIRKELESRGRERSLSPNEIALAERHCPPEWWPLFAILIHTGLRVSEAQGLTWGDICFDTRLISVRENGFRARLKTQSSVRKVPMTKELIDVLCSFGGNLDHRPRDPVFAGRLGDRRAAHRKWMQIIRKAGIAHATVHDLRHTFGVNALLAGIPIPRLQRMMGHSTPAMTLRYTQHLPEEYFASDAELLSRRMDVRTNEEPRSHAPNGDSDRKVRLLA